MNRERWERLHELFNLALERRPEEREEFLAGVGNDDADLQDELRSLLRSHEHEGILDGYDPTREVGPDQFERVSEALADRYALESEAGQGGMATVYLARDLKHQRVVAIKVLHPYLAHSLGVDRFLAEIETTAGLQHPHILPLFDSGEVDGFLFYVMPYVEGESLRHRLERERQLPIEDAVRLATHVAEALDYAHRRGVVHRDIKPGNVLLQDGQPMVSDFGIALAVGAARTDRLTQPGHSLGTPRYMSPEQVTADHPVGPASDIYSLACVLHEMLLGEPPHVGDSSESVLRKIVRGLNVAPREVRTSIPANVDAAIRCALERLPADRFKGARDFAAALADPTFTHGSVTDAGSRVARWRAMALGSAALFVAAAGVASWSLIRSEPSPPVERFTLTPRPGRAMLDTYVGVGLTLAPDGEQIVYVGEGPEGRQLWLRRLDALEPTPIPWTEGADNPVFSPDGSTVAFREGPNLKTVSLLGGLPTILLDDGVTGQYIDWASDGHIYFASDSIVARVPAEGGEMEPFTTRFVDARTRLPRALPDGRGLLVTLRRDAAAQATIGVVGPEGGPIRELVPGLSARYVKSGHIVYATPDGTLMAAPFDLGRLEVTGESVVAFQGLDVRIPGLGAQFALSDAGTLIYRTAGTPDLHEVVWVDRGGATTPLAPPWRFRADIDDSSVGLSPDDGRLVVSLPRGIGGGWDLWMRGVNGESPSRFTTAGIENRRPVWSRDGESLTYLHNDGQSWEVRQQRSDGVAPPTVLSTGLDRSGQGTGPREALLSATGEWLVFRAGSTDDNTNPDIFGMRVGVDQVARPLLAEEHVEWTPALSPDGRWLAYSSNETGRSEVYLRPFPDVSARQERVSVSGGDNPKWSPTGRELFYRTAADSLVAVEVTSTPSLSIGRQTSLFFAAGFLRGDGHPMYAVSADGQRFVMLARTSSSGSAELVLVRNWLEELNRLFP